MAMRYWLKKWLIGSALFIATFAIAQTSSNIGYNFNSPAQQQQFEELTQQLRCLVCQNESLWDSSAPLAKDLRNDIYQQVKNGEDDTAIKQYLVARYGQFILFKPEVNTTTYALWIVPFVLLLLGFFIVGFVVLRSKDAEKNKKI